MTFIQIFNDLNFVKSEVSNNDNLLKEKNKSDVSSEIKKAISDDVPKKKDQFEWDYLVSKLNVDGVTSNLLLNLEYIKKVDNVIEFNLQEEIKDILTEKSKLKLSEEIERFVKEKVVLNINIVNSVFSIICPEIEADVFQEKPVPLHDSLQSFPFFAGSVLPAEVVLPGFVQGIAVAAFWFLRKLAGLSLKVLRRQHRIAFGVLHRAHIAKSFPIVQPFPRRFDLR